MPMLENTRFCKRVVNFEKKQKIKISHSGKNCNQPCGAQPLIANLEDALASLDGVSRRQCLFTNKHLEECNFCDEKISIRAQQTLLRNPSGSSRFCFNRSGEPFGELGEMRASQIGEDLRYEYTYRFKINR